MKFIIDAQLPYSISLMLIEMGYDSIHTSPLTLKNNTPDSKIIEYSMKENRVVMTKDSDFLHSHLLHQQPEKLILIKTGNVKNSVLKTIIAH